MSRSAETTLADSTARPGLEVGRDLDLQAPVLPVHPKGPGLGPRRTGELGILEARGIRNAVQPARAGCGGGRSGREDEADVSIGKAGPQRRDLGHAHLLAGHQGDRRSHHHALRSPDGMVGFERPERHRARHGGVEPAMGLSSRDLDRGFQGPGRGELDVDRIERPSRHIVAERGHPLRGIRMDRDLALDQDVHARRGRGPLQRAKGRGVVDAIGVGDPLAESPRERPRDRSGPVSGLVRPSPGPWCSK